MSIVDKLIEEIQLGIEDTIQDMGEDAPCITFGWIGEDDIAWEIMNSVLAGHSLAVHNEVRRRMGFDPLKP